MMLSWLLAPACTQQASLAWQVNVAIKSMAAPSNQCLQQHTSVLMMCEVDMWAVQSDGRYNIF